MHEIIPKPLSKDVPGAATIGPSGGRKRYWSLPPVPALLILMIILRSTVTPTVFYDPPWLILIGNTFFIGVVGFLVAGIAWQNYLATGRLQVLWLGCGVFLFGIGGVLAAMVRGLAGGANLNVTIYNTGALLGAAFHFVAALILLAGLAPEAGAGRRKLWLGIGYGGSVLFMAALTAASLKGWIPSFFIQGVGPTLLRQQVLGAADLLFVFSCLVFFCTWYRNREEFLYWYAGALALTAISLTGFFIQHSVGSPVGWVGRFSQYLGGVYFLVALRTAVRSAKNRGAPLNELLAAPLTGAEERFRSAFAHAAIGFSMTTPAGRFVDVNPAYCAIIGYSVEELRELDFPRLIHPDDRAANMEQIEQMLSGATAGFTVENRYLRKGGQHVWVRKSVSLIHDAQGAPRWIIALIEDITTRKQAEEALRQVNDDLEQRVAERTSELAKAGENVRAERQRFLDVLETLPVIVVLLRPDHRVEWVNRAYRTALGDNIGRLCFESQFGRDEPCTECQAFTPLQSLTPHKWEWALPNGRIFEIYNFPFADADGSPMILEMDIDITERRQAEAALNELNATLERRVAERTAELRTSEERLRLLGDNLPESAVYQCVHEVDGSVRFVYFSAGIERLNHVAVADVLRDASTLHRQILPEYFERLVEAEARSERNLTDFDMEVPMRRPDGELRWMQLHSRPRRLPDGRTMWDGVQTDITDHKRAEAALLRSEKLASVGQMAASIAHEINNPLAAVTNALFIAKAVEGLPESVRQYLEIADAELRRITHITRQSLGFYRESSTPALTAVGAILDSAIELLKSKINAKHAVIERHCDADLQVTAVAGELRQVFSNLLANSLEAIEENGTVKIRASAETDLKSGRRCVRVSVADNGHGISPGVRQRVFEPFFTTKGAVGTGLGLWVSKQLIEKHGGTIRVHSSINEPRRGTTVSIVLPTHPAARSQSVCA